MRAIRPNALRTALACAAILALASPRAPAGDAPDPGRFLLITDIHFDPFYDGSLFGELAARPAEEWGEILERSQPHGFNARGTDSNDALLRSSLDAARRRLPDPDFILYPGDLMAHRWQERYDALAPASHRDDPAAYRAFTSRAIAYLAEQFRLRFPNTPILPTLGNDDSFCGDYMIEPGGPFLAMFTDTWAPLLRAGRELPAFRETFPRGGYYSVALPGPSNHRLVVLNSVVFSVNYENACGTPTRTPALEQLDWLDAQLDRARAAGESVWLLTHIPPGINSYNSAEVVMKGGAPVTFWQPELTSRFLQILRRHPGTIRAAFVGHTHMDDFRVVRLDGAPALFLKIAPAVSPIFGNNPGLQVYQYDQQSGALENYRTFYLTDLGGDPASWAMEYDFRETYGLPRLDPETIARLSATLGTDPALQKAYTRYYGVSAPPEFPPSAFEVYRCAIANVTPAEFLTCLHGAPKPMHPPTHPDRRKPAMAAPAP